jgi:hypothetical protein
VNPHANANAHDPPLKRVRSTFYDSRDDEGETNFPSTTTTSAWNVRHIKMSRYSFPRDNLTWDPRNRSIPFVVVSKGESKFDSPPPLSQRNLPPCVILEKGAHRLASFWRKVLIALRYGDKPTTSSFVMEQSCHFLLDNIV